MSYNRSICVLFDFLICSLLSLALFASCKEKKALDPAQNKATADSPQGRNSHGNGDQDAGNRGNGGQDQSFGGQTEANWDSDEIDVEDANINVEEGEEIDIRIDAGKKADLALRNEPEGVRLKTVKAGRYNFIWSNPQVGEYNVRIIDNNSDETARIAIEVRGKGQNQEATSGSGKSNSNNGAIIASVIGILGTVLAGGINSGGLFGQNGQANNQVGNAGIQTIQSVDLYGEVNCSTNQPPFNKRLSLSADSRIGRQQCLQAAQTVQQQGNQVGIGCIGIRDQFQAQYRSLGQLRDIGSVCRLLYGN
jgi:hypothetical protein